MLFVARLIAFLLFEAWSGLEDVDFLDKGPAREGAGLALVYRAMSGKDLKTRSTGPKHTAAIELGRCVV